MSTEKIFSSILIYIGFPFLGLHFVCLYLYPFSQGDWIYVQNVWSRWQGVIVGDFAAVSSIILFFATTHKEKTSRKNKLKANRILLTKHLSDMLSYCKQLFKIYDDFYYQILINNMKLTKSNGTNSKSQKFPTNHENLFYKCIEYEENQNNIKYLADLLKYLQINHSRSVKLSEPDSSTSYPLDTFHSYLCNLAKLVQMINKLFEYARLEVDMIQTKITRTDIHSGFITMEYDVSKIQGLSDYIDTSFND